MSGQADQYKEVIDRKKAEENKIEQEKADAEAKRLADELAVQAAQEKALKEKQEKEAADRKR